MLPRRSSSLASGASASYSRLHAAEGTGEGVATASGLESADGEAQLGETAGEPRVGWRARLARWVRRAPASEAQRCAEAHQADYLELLSLVDLYLTLEAEEQRSAPSLRSRLRNQTLAAEDVLTGLARALHSAGCPVWRLECHLGGVARGLGLPDTQFAVFPSHVQVTFSRLLSAGHGAKTLSVVTSPGLDMCGLEAADGLARRVASYATRTHPLAHTRLRNGDAGGAQADDDVAARAEALRGATQQSWDSLQSLGAHILERAATGPGFWFFHDQGDGGEEERQASSDDEENAERGDVRLLRRPPRPAPDSSDDVHSAEDDAPPGGASALRRACFLRLACRDALMSLRAQAEAPPLYRRPARCAAAVVASFGCAVVFFGGSWVDALVSGFLGAMVACLGFLADCPWGRRRGFARAYEFAAAACVALLCRAAACSTFLPPVCRASATLSALQWLLQGWDFTEALVELATRNALVGAAHLFTAVTVTALLGYGLDLGNALADFAGLCSAPADAQTAACAHAVSPRWWVVVFVPTALALSVMLNARARQLPHMVVVATATYGFSVALSGTNHGALNRLNTFLSAALAGALSNLYANLTGKPAMASATAAVFVLVPDGIAALDGVSQLFNGSDVMVGVSLTAQVLKASIAIGAGLFVGSLLVAPRELSASAVAREGGAGRRTGRGARVAQWLSRRRLSVGGRRGYERNRGMAQFF